MLARHDRQLGQPIFAFISAVLVTDLPPGKSRKLAVRRIVATVIGAGCGAVLAQLLPSSPWTVALGVVRAMLLGVFPWARDGAKVAGFVSGLIVFDPGVNAWHGAWVRLRELARRRGRLGPQLCAEAASGSGQTRAGRLNRAIGSPSAWIRLVETLLGVIVAQVVSYIPKLVKERSSENPPADAAESPRDPAGPPR